MYFNPRARMGARRARGCHVRKTPPFQSTRPHGGATRQQNAVVKAAIFQSTRPHGGATRLELENFRGLKFQSTRPHGGATHSDYDTTLRYIDFNPRARMGARQSPPLLS